MTAKLSSAVLLAAAAPATVDRDEGVRHARDELSDRIYQNAEPGLVERILTRVGEWLDWLGQQMSAALPGGSLVLGLLLGLLLVLLAGLVIYARPARRAKRHRAVFAVESPRTAADHRTAAEEHAAAGEHAEAIRERLRAITRDLEERAIITPRPGRTATELATGASAALPAQSEALHRAAALFNDVVYGDRPATADDAHLLRELDDQLRATQPVGNGGSTA